MVTAGKTQLAFHWNLGFPKGSEITASNPQDTTQNTTGNSWALLSHACNPCWLALRARMECKDGTGWLCRTELRAAPQTLICIARSTALGKKKIQLLNQRKLPIDCAGASKSQEMHPGLLHPKQAAARDARHQISGADNLTGHTATKCCRTTWQPLP